VDEAKEEAAMSDFMCEEQKYGAAEEFETAPAEQTIKPVVRNQPRYYLVGRRRGPKERMMLRDFLTTVKSTSSGITTDQRQTYLLEIEHKNRIARRQQERRGGERPAGGFKHEASKDEQQKLGEQVVESMGLYDETHVKSRQTPEDLAAIAPNKLRMKGVKSKDDERTMQENEAAKEKASRRRNPAKTIEDFEDDADVLTIGNDKDWVDFEEQEINNRRQEISTQTFWKAQSKETLASFYKSVFPGIEEAKSSKRTNHATCNVQDQDFVHYSHFEIPETRWQQGTYECPSCDRSGWQWFRYVIFQTKRCNTCIRDEFRILR
jgi:hypothetical protein